MVAWHGMEHTLMGERRQIGLAAAQRREPVQTGSSQPSLKRFAVWASRRLLPTPHRQARRDGVGGLAGCQGRGEALSPAEGFPFSDSDRFGFVRGTVVGDAFKAAVPSWGISSRNLAFICRTNHGD
ncbi:hypothetical protein GGTG_09399 [Gaeumannomyces tritici R3-111a-1]|uniref:Uncharacterized protein n=1 Tax=Gaeumannomyces tritici (strain R3-111a-1) TaxID=644352 RepID=J3P7A3_GAET3|nr:hypothetical protein GGTG_09399 [Gaeumannomyces tritici R3-111a-1]EJT72534.1 hypothetical protein GGTG_09399 [Gaeumannomyces tritici R3-111a-1]